MKHVSLILVTILAVALLTAAVFVRPSNRRRWSAGQEILPNATFNGNRVTIHNVRNFSYGPDETPTPLYEDRTYDLDKIESAWFVLVPFSRENRGAAHTLMSFGFADSQYVGISVEARKELGENYGLLKGVLRRFEIMYVIADERDLIGLRANVRNNDVYVYPIRARPEKVRELFVQMLERANSLKEKPEFYNTFTNNCTTNILAHANTVSPKHIPYGREIFLPGYADELANRLGLLDTHLSVEAARKRYLVNERARKFANDPDFSTRIRSE
jgi:hypothetical protein